MLQQVVRVLAAPAQVVTKVEHGEGPFCKSNFTVSFFVPFADQARPTRLAGPGACIVSWGCGGHCRTASKYVWRVLGA